MKVTVKFKWQDMWVGGYWENNLGLKSLYLCIIPMFPIKITFSKESKYSLNDIRRMMDDNNCEVDECGKQREYGFYCEEHWKMKYPNEKYPGDYKRGILWMIMKEIKNG
jgi:hypothetical protein